mmetsp:Transcript_61426/g.155152  ORF Transcript_61426/g.155152 Transcript_61426/m.155152 type:complete len:125 (-) Transcript_61426:1030-1404(-)
MRCPYSWPGAYARRGAEQSIVRTAQQPNAEASATAAIDAKGTAPGPITLTSMSTPGTLTVVPSFDIRGRSCEAAAATAGAGAAAVAANDGIAGAVSASDGIAGADAASDGAAVAGGDIDGWDVP